MTPNEIITAGVSGLALIVAGLALIYSRRSSAAAQKSATEAKRANDLMERQIELAVSENQRKLKREQADSSPHFNWRDGSYNGIACEANFQNIGGDVIEVAVKTDASDIGLSINPQSCIPKNGMGKVVFQKRNGLRVFPVPFTINCKTKLGEIWEKSFRLEEWNTIKIIEA